MERAARAAAGRARGYALLDEADGTGRGTELFLFPCALLAIVGFSAGEAIASRTLVILIYCASLALHGRYGAPLEDWGAEDPARLFALNAFSAASLSAFIGLRFARAK